MQTRYAYPVSLAAMFIACGTDPTYKSDPKSNPSHGGSAASGGSSSTGTHGGGASTSSAASSTGSTSNGEAGAGGEGNPDAMLSLTSVVAQVVGRRGDSLRFTVKGTRPAVGVNSIDVTFLDSNDAQINVFDANWDGMPDSAEGRVVFDAPVTSDSFVATATLLNLADVSTYSKVKVTLLSGDDQATPEIDTPIVQQTKVLLGAACDALLVKNRCDDGLSCSGKPTVCTAGVAPVIVELKYLHEATGPLILVRGTDPDDDVASMHVEFLNAGGKAIGVDINNDMTPVQSFDTVASHLSNQGSFFSSNRSAAGFDSNVPKVRVTAQDYAGNMSAPITVGVINVNQGTNNLACDARGFTGCIPADVCAPGLPVTAGRCALATTARAMDCSAAPKLDPAKGATIAVGRIDGVSLWDPPAGCSNPENTSRPEATVALHLGSTASSLTITTERPETQIDTVVYLLPGCADDSATALGCNDDDRDTPVGYASKLVLSNVAAGDYTIVVESGQMPGGPFGLSVSAQ